MNYTDIKALWISQFDMNAVYKNGLHQRTADDYTGHLRSMLDNTVANGFNTVIFQVRPYADSMYPSSYYPPCSMASGSYTTELEYDPFEILVTEAHARSLSVQAWINPMRAMLNGEISQVSDKYVIKQWYNDTSKRGYFIVNVSDHWYLNPAYPQVRKLIIDGAVEIFDKYDVDGLHMDDYFYPTTDASFDSAAYSAYKSSGGELTLSDFRNDSLTQLVKGLYTITKSAGNDKIFGISPAGNINTVANSHYADVYTWCKSNDCIDYICPQVYFGMEHESYGFASVCDTWQNVIKSDTVKLIIGMTLGKAKSGIDNYAGSGKYEWSEHKDVLLRCLKYTEKLEKCVGVAYFCYQYFYNPVFGEQVSETKTERDSFIPYLEKISWIK